MKLFLNILIILGIFFNSISAANNNNIVHFIKCGSADSILIESNGKYGLIDSSNPYKYIKNEVVPVQIDSSKGEINQWSSSEDESVQSVLNYLEYLNVEKLDFIIGTHAHSDHIGGIPAIAYKYVDSRTKYYYRLYRRTLEEITNVDWANYKYYLAAVNSMVKKGARLIDVTEKTIKFDFGDMNLELLNTDIDPDELNLGENQNSIVTLLKYNNIKLFLAADMISKDDQKIKDYIGKIDILKLAHHGYSESSYDFLSTTKPDYVVISNTHIPNYSSQIISYLKGSLGATIYLTQNIPGTTKNVGKSAIKLEFSESNKYSFSNTGNEVNYKTDVNGWSSWYDKWTYLENGKTAKTWRKLEWSGGVNWFYFNEDGIMLKGWNELKWSGGINWFYFDEDGAMLTGWNKLNWSGGYNWFYFDDNDGNMLTGWQTLDWSGGRNTFYFIPDSGIMVCDTCINIYNKKFCFDKDGCVI